jgi:enamine deaminase RidA (YjgF/YER057c/UK114 family)
MNKHRLSLAAAALLLSACATPRVDAPAKTIVVPAGWDETYAAYHYAPAVRVGDMVIVSGIPAHRGATYEEKIQHMFGTLKTVLEASGATLADVVEINTFHTEVRDTKSFEAEFVKFLEVHKVHFPEAFPAWTAVGTTALLAEGAPVEMRVVAVVGSGKNAKVVHGKLP